jgi:hypothetical protein
MIQPAHRTRTVELELELPTWTDCKEEDER